MCNKHSFFAESMVVGSCTEATGPLLLIITKTHKLRGGTDTPTEITPYHGPCLLPTIHHSVSINPLHRVSLKKTRLPWREGNHPGSAVRFAPTTFTHLQSLKKKKKKRNDGWHESDRSTVQFQKTLLSKTSM